MTGAEQLELLDVLRAQLPQTHGAMRQRTERAIAQLERELAGGREIAGKAATR